MNYSRYTVCFENGDKKVLFNTLNRQMKIVPQNLLETNIDSSKILKKELSDFLIESDSQDEHNLQYLMNSMVYQSTRINITLMMTMRCNFRCIYCFENWIPDENKHIALDENEIVEWILWLVKKYHIKQVDLCFHGGEPLLETRKILHIATKLKDFFEKNSIFYLFTVVTNGYLLNYKTVKHLCDAGIKIAQVTIDGIETIHNQRRPLANGQGTFKTIVDNIMRNDCIKIYISIVYDNKNAENVYQLIDYLKQQKMQDKINLIVLSATKPTINNNNIDEFQLSQIEDANLRVKLLEYITVAGFRVPFDVSYQLCTMKQKNSFVLTPDKMIYKCISGVGKDKFKLCSLKIGMDPFKEQAAIVDCNIDDDCRRCAYMPICNRYCLYESFVMRCGKICKKIYWDEFLPKYFSMYLKSKCKENFVIDPNFDEWEIHYDE